MSAHLVRGAQGEIAFRCGRCAGVTKHGFLHPKGGIFCAGCCQFGTDLPLFWQSSLARSVARITVLEAKLAQEKARHLREMARRRKERRRG